MTILKTVKLSSLKLDRTLQHRLLAAGALYSNEYLQKLKDNIRDIGLKRAIRCIQIKHEDTNPLTGECYRSGDLLVVDGIHRTVCLKEIAVEDGRNPGEVPTKVEVWKGGSFRDAMILSCRSNYDNEHTHARSLGDKSKAITDYIAFIKADAEKVDKIIFGIEYKRIAEIADCSEVSIKRHDGAKAFKAECKRNRDSWIKAMREEGESHRKIAKASKGQCYFGEGFSYKSVTRSIEYTFRHSAKEQKKAESQSRQRQHKRSSVQSTADIFMPVGSIAQSVPSKKKIANLSISPDQLIIKGLSEDEMVECLEKWLLPIDGQ